MALEHADPTLLDPKAAKIKSLQDTLAESKKLLWERMQDGIFKAPAQAYAIVDAHKAGTKALDLVNKQLSQLPLPDTTPAKPRRRPRKAAA